MGIGRVDRWTHPSHISRVRLLPSLTDVAFLMPLAFLFLRMGGATGMLGDGDTGWHVRTGEWILANGRVPHEDMFSYTQAPASRGLRGNGCGTSRSGGCISAAGMAAVILASIAGGVRHLGSAVPPGAPQVRQSAAGDRSSWFW